MSLYNNMDFEQNLFRRMIKHIVGWLIEPAYIDLEETKVELDALKQLTDNQTKTNNLLKIQVSSLNEDVNFLQKTITEQAGGIHDLNNITLKHNLSISQLQLENENFDKKMLTFTNDFSDFKNMISDDFEKNSVLLNNIMCELKQKTDRNDEQLIQLSSMAREIMRTKWHLKDIIGIDRSKDYAKCVICGYEAKVASFEKKISYCIFGGGTLERYICPKCGCVFGPLKFSRQSKDELDDDYIVHYLGYDEANSTIGEKEAFFLLNPTKDGIYLNYGCGKWADTISQLRDEGYNIYGFDLYAKDVEDPYVISDISVIKKMRFDGIFSHDLLEHLMNPVEDMLFMKSLLKSPSCKMAHSTACYEYKYEYTRFHTCFYTGNAVEALCQQANLEVEGYVDDGGNKDFICYTFGVRDECLTFLQEMGSTNENESLIVAENGEQIYGPYLNLSKGSYHFVLDVNASDENLRVLITTDAGMQIIKSQLLCDGTNYVSLNLDDNCSKLEFAIQTQKGQRVVLNNIGFVE